MAYTIFRGEGGKNKKFDNAYFGWMKFELDPDSVLKLKEALEQHDTILRFLIIKTVRESTLASKRPVVRRTMYKKKVVTKKEEPKQEINKEEVDKKIEELIVE